MANMGGRFDPKWIGKEEQKKAFFGPFLNAASERFRELAVRDGFWDDDMEVEEGADVEMS